MEKIYVKLKNEEIDAWRPVQASFSSKKKAFFIELPPINIVPIDEEWEFLPGMFVVINERESDGEIIKIAISQLL